MQHFLKTPPGAAGAGVVSAEFFEQFFVAVDDPEAALDAGFGGVAFPAFAAYFKSRNPRGGFAWCPPLLDRRAAEWHGVGVMTSLERRRAVASSTDA
jgi:hypothetical protein